MSSLFLINVLLSHVEERLVSHAVNNKTVNNAANMLFRCLHVLSAQHYMIQNQLCAGNMNTTSDVCGVERQMWSICIFDVDT